MHQITYKHVPGPVGDCLEPASYATTATVPVFPTASLVYTTGHIGLRLDTAELVHESLEAEFEAIFTCLDAALKNAGATRGLAQAYRFTSYLVRAGDEAIMQGVFRRMVSGHTPTWCSVLVKEINVKEMSAEIAAEGVIYSGG